MGIKLIPQIKVTELNANIPPETMREKRSLSLYGHRTSVALETPFWTALDSAAAEHNISLAGLICKLDDARITAKSELGLAAYLRVWVTAKLQKAI